MIKPLALAVVLNLLAAVHMVSGQERHVEIAPVVSSSGFVENRGQWPAEAGYLLQLGRSNAWIGSNAIVHDIRELPDSAGIVQGNVIRMEFVGGRGRAGARIADTLPGHYNFFIGRDSSRWATGVRRFSMVELDEIYSGIDARVTEQNGGLRYDLIVAPRADPSRIRLRFEGARSVRVTDGGELELKTSAGTLEHRNLYAYQMIGGRRQKVRCDFARHPDGTIGFALGGFDRALPLVIDPLVYSTYLGGSARDHGNALAVDASGSAHVGGTTSSPLYPVTTGAYSTEIDAEGDMMISKLAPDGKALIYSTFIGGSDYDVLYDMVINRNGEAVIIGLTMSPDFPVGLGRGFDRLYAGINEGVVFWLSRDGSRALGSSFIGGGASDNPSSLAIDSSGNLYVMGITGSPDFQVTPDAWRTFFPPQLTAIGFLTKIAPDMTRVLWSTFFEGTTRYTDNLRSGEVAVTADGTPYLVGTATGSRSFVPTRSAFDPSYNGGTDACILSFDPSGSNLAFATYLGGTGDEEGLAIAIAPDGDLLVTGRTESSDFPTTSSAPGRAIRGGIDGFVTRLDPNATMLRFSSFLGGSGNDIARDIAVDAEGNSVVTGSTGSTTFPCTPAAYDTLHNGLNDLFVTTFSPAGEKLLSSTFIGGSGDDHGQKLFIRGKNRIFVSGTTESPDFPTTAGAFDGNHNGAVDLFVLEIRYGCDLTLPPPSEISICPERDTVTLRAPAAGGTPPYRYLWSPAVGLDDVTRESPTVRIDETTEYTVTVVDAASCSASTTIRVKVGPPEPIDLGGDTTICIGSSVRLDGNDATGLPPYTWKWTPATGLSSTTVPDPVATPATTTEYTVSRTDVAGCTATGRIVITVSTPPTLSLGPDTVICAGGSLQLRPAISGGVPPFRWSWSPAAGLDGTDRADPMAMPIAVTEYAVTVTDAIGCTASDRIVVTPVAPPDVVLLSDTTICAGSSTRLGSTITGGTPPWRLSWSPEAGLDRRDVADPVATPTVTTSYTLTVIDALGCTTLSSPLTVTVEPVPEKPTISRAGARLESSPASAYRWFRDERILPVVPTAREISADSAGRYMVAAIGANGCSTMSDVVVVGPDRTVRLDTISGRVGMPLTLRLSISPPLVTEEGVEAYRIRLRVAPRSLVALDARAPDTDKAGTDPGIEFAADGTGEIVRSDRSGALSGETVFLLDVVGLVTGSPLSVVRIDSAWFDRLGPVPIAGNGLVILEGCDLQYPVALDRAVTIRSVSPNPIDDRAKILYYAARGSTPALALVDITGRDLIYHQLPPGDGSERQATVDLSALPSGLYRVELRDRNERSAVTAIVVH